MKSALLLSTVFSVFFLFSGCGSNENAQMPTGTQMPVGKSGYIVQSDVNAQAVDGADVLAMSAGLNQSIGSIVAERNSSVAIATNPGELTTISELRAIISKLSEEAFVADLSTINEQTLTSYTEFTVGDYSLTVSSNIKAVDLSNLILNAIMPTAIAGLPAADGNAVESVSFRMFLTVTSFNNQYYYTFLVTPESTFNQNSALMTTLGSGSNFSGTNELLRADNIDHTGRANSNAADFLFMVDDSGSMGENQAAIVSAADDFEAAIVTSGLDYNIAILTTGDGAADDANCTEACYDRVVQDVGIIDNNMTLFKEQVVVGTSGSGTETGIYNAEQALKTIANGDGKDGLLQQFNFPRTDTGLTIVIISDEESQYPNRAGGSFNPASNLFVRNDYFVHALVDTGLCGEDSFADPANPDGQYDQLANATGGLTGNICRKVNDQPDFSAIMQNIVYQAAGAYRLDYANAKPNSLTVTVNDINIPVSIEDGYLFIEASNSIAFFGDAKPVKDDNITVYYEFPKDIHLFANE